MVELAVCFVCGVFDNIKIDEAMKNGWVFTRCPECHRGIPFDIVATYLTRTVDERYLEGFCSKHWFKDSGICSYCMMKREEYTNVS